MSAAPDAALAAPAVARAQTLADELLLPAALATDRADLVPRSHLDTLAAEGFYGLLTPASLGGLGLGPADAFAVIEALAGGCLSTTFVWMQHLGASLLAAFAAPEAARVAWARPLATGRVRAGVAFAHLRRPGPPAVVATEVDGGWRIDGRAPWVTGWRLVDVVQVSARCGPDVVQLLVDAAAGPTLRPERLDLAALQATDTVELVFDGHLVPDDRCFLRLGFDEWSAADERNVRPNASLALGVASRAAGLLGPSPFDTELAARRAVLDSPAEPAVLAQARAELTVLTVRLTAALVAATGGRAMVLDHHAQRLAREALFLLVQGQTPVIRAGQRHALERSDG